MNRCQKLFRLQLNAVLRVIVSSQVFKVALPRYLAILRCAFRNTSWLMSFACSRLPLKKYA
ncbi:hypothetical protein D3C86_2254320 [compost metagenome]